MATISSSSGISSLLGQYSGIGAEQIEDLLKAEAAPKQLVENKVTAIQNQKTAWSDVKTRLTNLLNKLTDLQKPETFNSQKATTSDDKIATITGSTTAIDGTYRLSVEQLATSTTMTGKRVDSSTEKLNATGTLTFTTAELNEDGTNKTLAIELKADDTLKDVMQKINAETKNSGIAANIVDNRLVITDTKTGSRDLTVSGDGLAELGLDSATTVKGDQAKFTLNGIAIERDSNTLTDVVDGITIDLKNKTEAGKDVTLTLTNDTSKFKTAVKDFVAQYNSTMSLISDKLNVGDPSSSTNTQGGLAGDSTLTRLQTELRNMVTASFSTNSNLKPNQVGISITDRNGTLGFDEDKFDKALKEDPDAVKNFFYQTEGKGDSKTESGYATNLKGLMDKYLADDSKTKGIIATKFSTFETTIKDLNKQIERFDEILAKKKDRYVAMFTRLDQVLMEADSQMSWLVGQVDAMNAGK